MYISDPQLENQLRESRLEVAEQKEVLKRAKSKHRSQSEALREQFSLKKQKLTESLKARLGNADTKYQNREERLLARIDADELSRKAIMSENERLVNTLESEKAALRSQVSRIQEQLLRTSKSYEIAEPITYSN